MTHSTHDESAPSQPDLRAGDRIGPYRVVDLLGQGGMGLVYRATDVRLERVVALKVISKAKSETSDDFQSRLLREAKAVASLNHPNVVSIFDVGETDDHLYFAMEYVDGQNLRARIAEPYSSLSFSERIRWLADVALGLHAAHLAGVVHRDVKPENVMIRKDGLVKVLDFGIARRTRLHAEGSELVTGDDHVTGTPLYMAPEQLRGERLDARTDEFSWGVMAYELLSCGERPFSSSHEGYALVAAILTEEPESLRSRAPEVPKSVADVVHRALSKRADARYPSLEEVAAELSVHASARGTRSSMPLAVVDVRSHEPAAFAETTRVPTTKDQPPSKESVPSEDGARTRKWRRYAAFVALPLVVIAAVAVARRPKPTVKRIPERPLCLVPEAAAELGAARKHVRDGAESEALRELQRATELDDGCAAAHLDLALKVIARDPQEGLKHYQAAFHAREILGHRDFALLEASEPFLRTRPDLVEWETRLTGAVYKYPDDPALRVWLGTARERQYDIEGAKAAFQAATRMDPGYAPAWAGLANAEKRLGDSTAALGAVAACLSRSPVASVCLGTRHDLYSEGGECAHAREDATAWVALDPASPEPQRALAASLFAVDAPRPAVEEALRRRWSLLRTGQKQAELVDKMDLAIVDGRFDDALALADTWEPSLPADADVADHAAAAMIRVSLLVETGQTKRAAEVAKDFLDRMMAYPPYPLAPDPSIGFAEPLYRAGMLSVADLEARRTEWSNAEIARTRATDPAVLGQQRGRLSWLRWALVYGSFAETREEAQAALRAIPSDTEPPVAQRSLRFDFAAGKVLASAGEHVHAVEHLKRVANACTGLWEPQLRMRASFYLGMAYEARGDRAAAIAAYRVVYDKWGNAKPRSVTAEKARQRLSALGMKLGP
jgi:serine/threonine protein kinase/tetratricopeptide (TPR) repeat protein